MAESRNKILFVCTANICRSPMGQKLLEHALQKEPPPLGDLEIDSAGVAAYPGDTASENAVRALRKVGLSLEDHRSQPVTAALLAESLAVFCMTENHRQLLLARFSGGLEHVYLMREFLQESAEREIPDPFGADLASYEACRDSMVEAIPSIVKFLKTLA